MFAAVKAYDTNINNAEKHFKWSTFSVAFYTSPKQYGN